jgi:hypothetical protein
VSIDITPITDVEEGCRQPQGAVNNKAVNNNNINNNNINRFGSINYYPVPVQQQGGRHIIIIITVIYFD